MQILDPIDGTKGFISNGQFAIGLAFVQEGQPILGIVGAPNFPYQLTDPAVINWSNCPGIGCVCVGIKGKVITDIYCYLQAAVMYDLYSDAFRQIDEHHFSSSFSAVISKQSINHTTTLNTLLQMIDLPDNTLEIDRYSLVLLITVVCASISWQHVAMHLYI